MAKRKSQPEESENGEIALEQAMAELADDGERVLIIKTIFHSEQTIHVPCEFQLKF